MLRKQLQSKFIDNAQDDVINICPIHNTNQYCQLVVRVVRALGKATASKLTDEQATLNRNMRIDSLKALCKNQQLLVVLGPENFLKIYQYLIPDDATTIEHLFDDWTDEIRS